MSDVTWSAGRRLRELWICVSPKAGSGDGRQRPAELSRLASAAGVRTSVTESVPEFRSRMAQWSREKMQWSRETMAGGDPGASDPRADDGIVVVAAGGDGTLSLIASHTPPHVPIVPMPLGTENLLARHFRFPSEAAGVWATVCQGTDAQIDAGVANGRMFLLMASAGFDAEVVRAVHLRRRGHIGHWSYVGPILRAMRKYRFPQIEIRWRDESSADCGMIHACWAMAFNLPCYGFGLNIESEAVPDDGRLDLITFRDGSVPTGMRYAWDVYRGRHIWRDDVVRRRAFRIELSSPGRVPYQLDGDYSGHLPVTLGCLPGRVRLRLPPGPQ